MPRSALTVVSMFFYAISSVSFGGDGPALIPAQGTGRASKPGDEAQIYDEDTPGCVSMADLKSYVKSKKANDRTGLEEHQRTKRGFSLARGTKILVIEAHLEKVDMTPMSPEAFDLLVRAGANREKPTEAVEVRVLEGEHKGERLFVPVDSVALMKPDPDAIERRRKEQAARAKTEADEAKALKKAQLARPEAKSASLLNIAKNLEKSGKREPALKNYREIVKDFEGTPAAKEAAARIKALEGK